MADATQIRIDNVRLSFPALFEERMYEGKPTGFGAHFLLDGESTAAGGGSASKAVQKAMSAAAKEKWGAKAKSVFTKLKEEDRICLRPGSRKTNKDGDTLAGYNGDGVQFVSANSPERPKSLTKSGQVITPENRSSDAVADQVPYSGCRVNVLLTVWAQDHKLRGRRLNAKLEAVMFNGDDEPLGGGPRVSDAAAKDAFADAFEDVAVDPMDPADDAFAGDEEEEEEDLFGDE